MKRRPKKLSHDQIIDLIRTVLAYSQHPRAKLVGVMWVLWLGMRPYPNDIPVNPLTAFRRWQAWIPRATARDIVARVEWTLDKLPAWYVTMMERKEE